MLETKSIGAILDINFTEEIDVCVLETIGLRISNNPKYLKLLDDKGITEIIGLNEKSFIKKSNAFIYNNFTYKDATFKDFEPNPNLKKLLVISEFYCQALWIIKDNSVQFEQAHLIFSEKTNEFMEVNVHSNFWNSAYSNAIGQRITTEFTREEIEESELIFLSIFSANISSEQKNNSSILLTNSLSRLVRAFYFLRSARTTSDIGTKISIYISVLESLFSVSNNELRHRLSENIAFFLSDYSEERMEIYKTVQTAYDIRSSIVHGDGLQSRFIKNDAKLLLENAIETDSILRNCFKKILQNDKLYDLFTTDDKKVISNYFKGLIFGAEKPARHNVQKQ